MASAPVGSFFTTGDCMVHRFEELPKAITNTQEIAERCNLELPVGIPHFPEITCQNGETAISILRRLAERGAVKKYGKITPQIRERIDHELQVIDSRGYAPLFLIVQDIMEFAQKSGIPTSSRGSAASSLVAYCLGITTPDPLALNLYFERFLNPSRSTPPDIDIDLCSKRRDKVIAYVYEQYGKNRVAMVATVNRFQKRSALREVSKAYGLTTAEINQLINSLPSGSRKPSNLRKNKAKNTFEMMVVRYPGAKYQAIFHDAKAILGFPRHLSIHPGGIVIAPDVITNLVPTQLANKGIIITQFDLDSVERLGLVKIDLLGTRGLSVLGDVAEKIHQWCPIEYSSSLSVLESITDEDQETIELLKATQTIGCFSIESPGMRATLQEIQAKSPEDIMIALALYRPGPMTGGLKNVFVRRHLGQEPVEHIHPSLVSLLGNTNGIILYQEQVLRIASEMAGLSLSDADLLRRAMSHFDPGDQMRTLKVRFVDGAQSKSSVPIETAEKIWDLMAAFAGYGFPKAHAASYAQVAWRSVWCKAHYPAEFLAAVLAGWGGYYRQHVYIHEARRLGLKIYPPHINHSTHQFTATYLNGIPALYMGLDQVLDLSQETQKRIMARNPFHSLNEFLTQVDPSPKEAQNLIRVGALRGLGAIPDLLAQVISRDWRLSQPRLLEIVREHISGEDWSLSQRVDAQEKILGIGLDAHPIELVYQKLGNIGVISTREARKRINNDIRVAGIRQTIQRFHAPDGKVFYSLELDDPTGVITVHLSEAQYQQNRKILSTRTPFIIHGEMVIDPLTQVACLDARKVESLPAS
jgi:DNA polymerase-3 subunit alpha